jgi:uncharacterized membrane protein
MAKTIVGSFDNFNDAQRVARELMDDGFASSDINVVASNVRGEFKTDDRVNVTDTSNAATGAVAGGVLGGAAGLAVSLMGLTVPGLGPIIAAGPLAATLSGAGAGLIAGGLIGGLTEMGVSKPDAEYYAEAVRRGGALVTVRADDTNADRAVDIMREHGAVDIDKRASQWREKGWSGWDDAAAARPYSLDEIERDREMYNVPGDAVDVTTTRPPGDYARNPGLRR